MGVAEDEEVGGAQRVELRFVTSEAEEAESQTGSDFRALVRLYRHGYGRVSMFVCVCGGVVFITGTHTHTHPFYQLV